VIESGGDLEIRANSLNNDRGKIISRRKATFIVRDRFDNHGNCLVDHDVTEEVAYYTPLSSDRAWRKGPLGSGVDTQRNVIENKRDVYGWDSDNTSTITSYGAMAVSVASGDFDNSFGSLCALSGISINAHDGNVVNENGKIFVRGRAVFSGKNFRNGYVKGDRIFSGPGAPHEVDPEVVIGLAGYGQNIDVSSILDKIGPNSLYPFVKGEKVQVWNEHLANEGASVCVFGPPIAGNMTNARRKDGEPAMIIGNDAKTFVNASVSTNNLYVPNNTPSEIVKTYKPLVSHSQTSAESGQIYATDDVEIRTEGERYFGTITAGKDIIANNSPEAGVSVVNSHDRSRLIAGRDVKIALWDPSDRKYLSVQAKSL
jgi:adhesin HecA-like repeat protein